MKPSSEDSPNIKKKSVLSKFQLQTRRILDSNQGRETLVKKKEKKVINKKL